MEFPKTKEEVKRLISSPVVFCQECGIEMTRSEPEIFDVGFDIDTGGLKWEFSQKYTCPNNSKHKPIYKVTNYLNSSTWYDYKRMDHMPSGY